MKLTFHLSHPWDVTLEEAERIQNQYRHAVRIAPLAAEQLTCLTAIAARNRQDDILVAAVTADVVKHTTEIITEREKTTFPYHSGYLAFHQAPAILKALTRLNQLGDVIIVSGHGLAHPRRFGLASHLGVLLDIPTIGCARRLLPSNELQPSEDPLMDWVIDAEGVVGIAVYQQNSKNPWILSIGHRTDVDSLLTFKYLWLKNHRLPDPFNLARRLLRA
ncbi:MAG: endonuclease V [Anaerolineales bacterium]|nr:endonuclease V [Anaerolineales bacterium]